MKKFSFILFPLILLGSCFSHNKILYDKNEVLEKLIPIELKGKIGFINQKFEVVVLPEYDKLLRNNSNCFLLRKIEHNTQTDFLLLNKKNILEIENNAVVSFIGDKYYSIMPRFINKSNLASKIYKITSMDEPYIFKNLQVKNSVSINNILVVNPFQEDLPRYFLMNLNYEKKLESNDFNEIVQVDENEEFAVIRLNNFYYSIIDLDGNRLTRNEYFKLARSGNGLMLGELDKETGFYDKNGNLIISVEISNEQDIFCCPVFSDNVLPCIYENGKITVQETGIYNYSSNWAIINTKGNFVAQNIEADYISNFSKDGTAVLIKNINGHNDYYLINSKGKILNQIPFDYISESINSFSRAKLNNIDYIISTKDGSSYKVFEILLKMKD